MQLTFKEGYDIDLSKRKEQEKEKAKESFRNFETRWVKHLPERKSYKIKDITLVISDGLVLGLFIIMKARMLKSLSAQGKAYCKVQPKSFHLKISESISCPFCFFPFPLDENKLTNIKSPISWYDSWKHLVGIPNEIDMIRNDTIVIDIAGINTDWKY